MRLETIAILFCGTVELGSITFRGSHADTVSFATAKRHFPAATRAHVEVRRFDPDGDYSVIVEKDIHQ